MAASSEMSTGQVIAILNSLGQIAKIADSVNKSKRHAALNQLIVKLISTLIGLTASVGVSYFGFKYLAAVLDPTKGEKQESLKRADAVLKRIGIVNPKFRLTEYEMCIACNLVHEPDINTSWQDIGGLEDTIRDIQQTVILPFKHHSLFSGSKLLQPPKGVLLYGPPGCGKTLIAKATAKAAGARFINLQLSSLVDKWYGESQKRAEAVFSLAVKLQPVIIFIDEIDSLLRSRTSNDHEATGMIKTQFMSLWDGLLTDPNCRVMIMGATNRAQDVDQAILRRMPCTFYVGLPDIRQRKKILDVILRDERVAADVDLQQLAEKMTELNGSDIREVCRTAALNRVRTLMLDTSDFGSQLELDPAAADWRCIRRQDFELAITKMKSAKLLQSPLLASAAELELD